MPPTEITCVDCKAAHTARRSDAKYCPSDRLLRVLLYAGKKFSAKGRPCRGCRTLFLPMHGKDLSHCGACEAESRTRVGDFVSCAFCLLPERPALAGSPVKCCIVCAKDPDIRPNVIKALKKGRRQRLKENT